MRERVLTNREGWWRHPIEGNREEGRERGDCEIEGCKCERENETTFRHLLMTFSNGICHNKSPHHEFIATL